jgi:hypothetical protein
LFRPLPPAHVLRERYTYCPQTGELRNRRGNVLSSRCDSGYIKVAVWGRLWFAHRVIWKMVTGLDPEHTIDHINRVRHDNRWVNLRDVPMMENLANRGWRPVRKRDERGVHRTPSGFWRADISVNGKNRCLGIYATKEKASGAYWGAEAIYRSPIRKGRP